MTNELDMVDVSVTNWMLATAIRRGEREDAGLVTSNCPRRTAVLVCGRAPQAESLDVLLAATSDYDVIVVETIAHSYSCIKRVMPDLVVVSSEVDDVASCQLLSMLRADRGSSGIPVLTCPPVREQPDFDDDLSELDQDMSAPALAAAMN